MDDFYTLSKILGILAAPSNVLVLLAVFGVILLLTGLRRTPSLILAFAVLGMFLTGFSPLANYLVSPLEERFPPYVSDGKPVDGIIMLGGAEVPDVALARGITAVNDAAERIIVFAALARQYPQARLVVAAGSTAAGDMVAPEAEAERKALQDVGVDLSRVVFEQRSRNTIENAAFSKALVNPQPGQKWLLVTSAFHMPRAIACFRAVDFPVTAYPVDYRTVRTDVLDTPFTRVAQGQDLMDIATREWVGLAAYYFAGKTKVLFPAP
ncbi:YdcF family protein [Roseixanthobacter glucoisosaccharinicivorans]|uniref:YdcF family protein n=1 Tax=Roseixanthobacter glucoisosaccharinicivorans TaxID=3119923 RepID=UPI00372CA9E7